MTGSSRARIFLLTQNRLLREVLSKILLNKYDLQVVGCGPFSPDTLQQIIATSPDVLIVDSSTRNAPVAELVRCARHTLIDLKLVLIGMDPEDQSFIQAIRDGAMGYLVSDASALEVVSAVRTVVNGGAVCSPDLCASLFRFVARHNQLPNFQLRTKLGLTTREQQLVALISRGLTNKEIASELGLAEQTVRNHVHRMLRKLGATHRLGMVEICRMEGVPV